MYGPIALLNSIHFGSPEHFKTKSLLNGVVSGIGGYGNCIGIPTVAGETKFNKTYNKLFTVGGSKKSFTSLKNLTKICEKITGNNIKFKKILKTSNYDIPYYISDNRKISKTSCKKSNRKRS